MTTAQIRQRKRRQLTYKSGYKAFFKVPVYYCNSYLFIINIIYCNFKVFKFFLQKTIIIKNKLYVSREVLNPELHVISGTFIPLEQLNYQNDGKLNIKIVKQIDAIIPSEIFSIFSKSYHCFRNTCQIKMTYSLFYSMWKASYKKSTILYKQLGSGVSPHIYLYLENFWSWKLLSSCLKVWLSTEK